MSNLQEEFVQFAEETSQQEVHSNPDFWVVLLVDDEPDVHAATKLALKNVHIEGRPLKFIHAHSAQEAETILSTHPCEEIAVAMIDVVMESDDAGLKLVHYIRQQLKNKNIRIILRTGQPGYAPEIRTIEEYDINDYRTKTELTLTRLFTSLALAIRAFHQLKVIENLAYIDSLVNLPNRNSMLKTLNQELHPNHCVALIDLDNFSDINSILDEHYGDSVLKAVSAKLRFLFSDFTLVARLGNDLFGLYGPEQEVNPHNIAKIFTDPLLIDNSEPLRLSATSGLVRITNLDEPAAEIIKNAGAALKQAKRLARGKSIYFQNEQSTAARDRITMLNMLRTSLSEQHLELYYQPLIRLADQKVTGAECLLRWQTPDGKFIPPDVFIPIAEQSGLMLPIGDWVFKTALNWRKSLQGIVDDQFRVAINVSHAQFAEPDFVERVTHHLKTHQVSGQQVEIELTESIAIENFDLLENKLKQLQALNIHLAMDDFGTGFSSLSVLQRLTLDRLKVDRTFISGQGDNTDFDMAKTIISMATHLNLKAVAEGIETSEQLQAMLEAGCQYGQGYLFSKPLAEPDFLKWLDAHQSL